MDNVESIELDEEGLDIFGPPATVTVDIYFKNGEKKTVKFDTPLVTPVYAEPLTSESVYDILSTAYSFGETPFLALPDADKSYVYLDLSATNYIQVSVQEHE